MSRKVALKVLKPELAAVVGADRFLAEIKTTANLQHPHILPLFDSGEADGFLFYVMPCVEGESATNGSTGSTSYLSMTQFGIGISFLPFQEYVGRYWSCPPAGMRFPADPDSSLMATPP